MSCYNCKEDATERSFHWIDKNNSRRNTLLLNLCDACNTNVRINYDVFGVPLKKDENEVKESFIYTHDIFDIWSKHFYENIKNL